MILTCPQCATQYRVDAAKFPAGGRTVRCAKCGQSWHQDAPAAEAAPQPAPEPVFAAPEPEPKSEPVRAPEPVSEPPRRAAYVEQEIEPEIPAAAVADAPAPAAAAWPKVVGLGLGWFALVVVVLVIGFAAFIYRQQVAQAWPRSASLYAALGLKVNPVGIDFLDVTHTSETEDGQSVLAVRGKLVNVGTRKVAVPPIELVLQDAANHEVLRKSFRVAAAELEPGEIMPFLARLSSPPAAARRLNLRFAKP